MTETTADRIAVRTFGTGSQPVLALHCGLGSGAMWKGVSAFAPSVAITAPDLPGHGRSAPFEDGRDVHDQATEAMRPLFAAGVHLVGHSFGATVALRLALETPALVSKLTLIEPVFFAAAQGRAGFEEQRKREEAVFSVFETGDHLAAARAFNRVWGGGIRWERFSEAARQAMANGMPFVAATKASLWQDCHGLLNAGGLESLTMPVQFLRGAQTVPIIAEIHAGLMARLPHTHETVVPEAGHMLVSTHPEAVASVLRG
ncbi:alpha/beta fold hydrolase [Pacificoceanicola onchidii]|uniref:alpha/beta fold hydrolase n=1 Tax=Pacificoceanicola onchidii TaxID=2562685 RepID=UPI0010A4DDD6|nr:alpha/beta hydrolase [Pacificoceanicola onchidii]